MEIRRKSPFSGKWNTMEINVTTKQILAWQGGAMIQDVMPNISAEEREFIMTGITPNEWLDAFGED